MKKFSIYVYTPRTVCRIPYYPGGTPLQNLLRLEAGYPALRCHNFKTINRSHAHNTHDKNKDDTEQQNTKTLIHTQDTLTLTQRRATTA